MPYEHQQIITISLDWPYRVHGQLCSGQGSKRGQLHYNLFEQLVRSGFFRERYQRQFECFEELRLYNCANNLEHNTYHNTFLSYTNNA